MNLNLRFGYHFVHSPDRLSSPLVRSYDSLGPNSSVAEAGKRVTRPLVKLKEGFVEVGWEEAIKYVAGRLAHYKGDQFAGLSSAKCTNEENYLFQKFVRAVMGTNNIDHCARL